MKKRVRRSIIKKVKGFTLLEILVVIGIIGLLTAVVIASIKGSKDKAADLEVKGAISDIAVKVEQFDIAPGVVDYEQAFESADVPATVANLAMHLGVSDNNYEYAVSPTSFAIVFPLRNSKYWCVDNVTGQTRTKEVNGLFDTGGPKDCDNASESLASRIADEEPEGYVCEYGNPPVNCVYTPGPDYDEETNCGLELSCSGGNSL